jgi:probable rRNA maturation factor
LRLRIQNRTFKLDKSFLEKVANAAFSYLNVKKIDGEIELLFVSEQFIKELNIKYRKVNAPTDVLSFNICDEPLLGQIFICYTYTKRQASKASKKFEDEAALLLVHGILHIFGYDHLDLSDEHEMQEIERKILGGIGIKR